jgi:hypothetical protein
MYISKRFNKKFKDDLKFLQETFDFDNFLEVFNEIIYVGDFNNKDFFDLFDYVSSRPVDPMNDMFHFELINRLLVGEMSVFYDNWNYKTIKKYKKFFKYAEDMIAMFNIPTQIFDYYAEYFDWNKIFLNTFFIDQEHIDESTFTIIEKHYKTIFSNRSKNQEHNPAEGFMFIYAMSLGVQLPFEYIKESLLEGKTTFSKFIIDNNMIQKYTEIEHNNNSENPIIFGFNLNLDEGEISVDIVMDVIFKRIIADTEIMNQIQDLFNNEIVRSSLFVDDDFDF